MADETRTCAYTECGRVFPATPAQQKAGKIYCSDRCGARARVPHKRATCICGDPVPPTRTATCSQRCAAHLGAIRRAENARDPRSRVAKARKVRRERHWNRLHDPETGRRPWAYASDTREAQAERKQGWTETDERPRVGNAVRLGAVTPHGQVAAAGIGEDGRYYMLMDPATGAVSRLPAAVVEGGIR
jgi:hypothetical protein